MKTLFKSSVIALLTIFAISCDSDDNGNVITQLDPTISEFVAANTNYTSLLAALERANLTATLNGTDNFTVFAPNNAAFATFLNDNGFASLEDVPEDLLRNVLLNHVVSGTNASQSLTTGYVNSLAVYGATSNYLSLYVDLSSGVKINGVSNVTTADVAVSNGVVHAVDAVIGLPTVVTFALADPTFATLVAALTRADQPDYVSTLVTSLGSDPAPFTVFAPTNDAFSALLTELSLGSLDDVPTATLTATLNTHVIAGANVRAEDLVDGSVPTLGDAVVIDATNATVTDQNGRVCTIIATNVQAANGVIHAIDKVLLPM